MGFRPARPFLRPLVRQRNGRRRAYSGDRRGQRVCPERGLAGLVRDLAGGGRREELRLVHHHEHRVPVVALGLEPVLDLRLPGPGGAVLADRVLAAALELLDA